MRITYDPAKRRRTLEERGLDFERSSEVFEGLTLEVEDNRHDYGEKRILCVGYLDGRIGDGRLYTSRSRTPHIFDEEMQ